MSRMKHLLRKLHIGGATLSDHHRLPPSSSSTSSSQSSSSSSAAAAQAQSPTSAAPERAAAAAAADFNFFEEEFQVQLALAISVSDPDARQCAQIEAAQRISLGAVPAPPPAQALVDLLSLQYWNYNVINYDEKVVGGFYDVYGIISNPNMQGKMPSLMDLQAISISDDVEYEVVLVDRVVDQALQQLEREAVSIAVECRAAEPCPILSGLVQRIADLVVQSMGGLVGDADHMLRRWAVKSSELRSTLNSIVLPLGLLEVGLSRHRALLFKVLADRIDLPCRLVKGSYYTGTDEGAVNLIKIAPESEYIIDLMGAPGTLIPAEMPNDNFQDSGLGITSSRIISETIEDLCVGYDGKACYQLDVNGNTIGNSLDSNSVPILIALGSEEAPTAGTGLERKGMHLAGKDQTERFEHEFSNLLPSLGRSHGCPGGIVEADSPALQMKVKDVSKYVISAAQDPEFAQKLHGVLLESGASPPPDLFSNASPLPDLVGQKFEKSYTPFVVDSGNSLLGNACNEADTQTFQADDGICNKQLETRREICLTTQCRESTSECMERNLDAASNNQHNSDNMSERSDSMLDNVAEWEIPWEDLQIGERIGLGSYGEVYHADWNGTEVAVKKFLDQDFSGDALHQFRCEVEIMLRLRHPNVVLFMGAVTRPPNLSILTEFLPSGSLYRLLHRPNVQLDEKQRLRMALDVAKGMNYLHTSHPTIVHRDLKSPNLLVDKNWVVKVCDFGLSRLKHHTFLSSKSTAGTPEWMAPEVLKNEPSNEKCDVYSFGVILWELATLRMPWSRMNPMQVVGAVGFQNRRLEITREVDPMVAQIINDCWQSDPNLRPSFAQLMTPLKHLKRLVVEIP